MNRTGLSSISLLLIGAGIVVFTLFIPLPHYDLNKGWYSGPSLAIRLLGSYEKGSPIDQVYKTVADAIIKSPFETTCTSDSDCGTYTVVNQCKVYCANLDGENATKVSQLEKNRVCDPAFWSRPKINCSCVLNRCVTLTE